MDTIKIGQFEGFHNWKPYLRQVDGDLYFLLKLNNTDFQIDIY